MKCAITGQESNSCVAITINGQTCHVLPRFARLENHLKFIDEYYTSDELPSSHFFEFVQEIKYIVSTSSERFSDNPVAGEIFSTFLTYDMFEDLPALFSIFTHWLDKTY